MDCDREHTRGCVYMCESLECEYNIEDDQISRQLSPPPVNLPRKIDISRDFFSFLFFFLLSRLPLRGYFRLDCTFNRNLFLLVKSALNKLCLELCYMRGNRFLNFYVSFIRGSNHASD